tara:strand:+ start:1077 stop:2945 length:1869 start_codon:yes stop_codon:yes gene_type:complete
MIKIIIKPILFISLLIGLGYSQFQNPVTVFAESENSVRPGEVAYIQVEANMDDEWHIYALKNAGEGPVASRIKVDGNIVEKQGLIEHREPTEKYDEGFGVNTRFFNGTTVFRVPVKIKEDAPIGKTSLSVYMLYQVCNESLCYPPAEVNINASLIIDDGPVRKEYSEFVSARSVSSSSEINLDDAIAAGFWSFVLLSISMGFLALLTPCVFPMIPITVSFFTHQGELENQKPLNQALVYTLGIVATFSILGMILAITLGAAGANQLAANPWVNLFIGALFVYFALSLFGAYEIQLPQSLRQLSLAQEKRGGYIGTLFMAVTFTLTSFTCTVQFVGLLLVAASQGQWFWPLLGMIVFSTAFATPFFFLALFPQYLAKMPKSGGWLNSVKVVMGFLELAAAFKFFSNTDLVWGWGVFTFNSVLSIWTVIMFFTGLYLLGKIQLPHDSKLESLGVTRMMLSLFFLTFSLYMGTGLFGRPIHGMIYSYLPPKLEKDFSSIDKDNNVEKLIWYSDLEQAFTEAKLIEKPIFIDFTGYTCTNCRWMETNIFTLQEVEDRFNEMILVHLYTDGGENHKEYLRYEIERFGTAALPYYVILSPHDEVLATFPGLTRDVNEFLDFIDKGLAG